MTSDLTVGIDDELLLQILECARSLYPKETMMLLRGKKKNKIITVSELIIPPLATYGHGFSSMPLHMLPIDFSIMGTIHSHPSGNLTPSSTDLNHFFGSVLMIAGYPYVDVDNVAVYNRNGERLALEITKK